MDSQRRRSIPSMRACRDESPGSRLRTMYFSGDFFAPRIPALFPVGRKGNLGEGRPIRRTRSAKGSLS